MSENLKDETILARWLSGELSAEERRQVEAEPDFAAWQAIVEGVDELEPDLPATGSSYETLRSRLAGRSGRVRRLDSRRRWLAVAASLLLLAGFFWWWNQGPTQVQTARVEQKSVDLPDGSLAHLKPETNLLFFRGNARTVELEGEAVLEVEKSEKPFWVRSPYGSVQVLGTTFNVYARDGVLEVRCYSGRVAVFNAAGANKITLAAGQAIRLIDGNTDLEWRLESDAGHWQTAQRSTFKGVPLERVMEELARIYDLTFIVDRSAIDTRELYTGFFDHTNLDEALRSVFGPMGIRAAKGEGQAVRLEVAAD